MNRDYYIVLAIIRHEMYKIKCKLIDEGFQIIRWDDDYKFEIYDIKIEDKEFRFTYESLLDMRLQFGKQFNEELLNLIVGE